MLIQILKFIVTTAFFVTTISACNAKDPQTANKAGRTARGPPEPKIVSADGIEVKYGEANKRENLTFNIDDRIVLPQVRGDDSVTLRYTTSCIRGGERFQIVNSHTLRGEYSLFEFMPLGVLYSPDGQPFLNVTCTLEITAQNSSGSRHEFPSITLPMTDVGTAKLELFLNAKKIGSERVQTLSFLQLEKLELPTITADERLTLYCASFEKQSTDKYVRNVSDLKIIQGQVRGDETRPQYCRMIKSKGEIPLAVSPFMQLRFFNSEGLIQHVDAPIKKKGGAHVISKQEVFLTQKIVNRSAEPIHLIWPKLFPVTLIVKHSNGIYKGAHNLKPIFEGAKVELTEEGLKITVSPKSVAKVTFILDYLIWCQEHQTYWYGLERGPDQMIYFTDPTFTEVWSEIPHEVEAYNFYDENDPRRQVYSTAESSSLCHRGYPN